MSRPTDWSPLGLNRDPLPGDPLAVSASARRYGDTATGIKTAVVNLRRLNGSSLVSEAFQVAFERIEDVAKKLDSTESRVSGAAVALDQYGRALDQAQLDSLAALRDAEQARGEKQRHDHAVAALANAYNSSTDPAQRDQLKERYHRETAASTAASREIDAAKRTIENAILTRNEAAEAAIHALDDADRGSNVKDNLWDKAVDWFEKNILPTLKTVVESIAAFAKKYGTLIDIVGAVLSILALFIPGVGPLVSLCIGVAFAQLSIFLSSMTMADAAFKFQDGTQTAEEFRMTMAVESVSIGLSVLSIGRAGWVLATGKVLATASKPIVKQVLRKTVEEAVGVGVGEAKRQVSDGLVDSARRGGEERLHQERIQQEARMRQYILQHRQQGSASGNYYRRQVAPCYAGGM